MRKVYHYYIRHSRMEKLLATNTDVIVFISGLVGKLAEYLTEIILYTVSMTLPFAIWFGIPVAISMHLDEPVDTQWKAFAILGAVAAWVVLGALILVYLNRPGKPSDKK